MNPNELAQSVLSCDEQYVQTQRDDPDEPESVSESENESESESESESLEQDGTNLTTTRQHLNQAREHHAFPRDIHEQFEEPADPNRKLKYAVFLPDTPDIGWFFRHYPEYSAARHIAICRTWASATAAALVPDDSRKRGRYNKPERFYASVQKPTTKRQRDTTTLAQPAMVRTKSKPLTVKKNRIEGACDIDLT